MILARFVLHGDHVGKPRASGDDPMTTYPLVTAS